MIQALYKIKIPVIIFFMSPVYFINGQFYPQDKAVINVKDLSILRGYGVFDYLRTYHQKPFHLDEHIDRLFNSAKFIDLDIPWNKEQIKKWVFQTLSKNNFPESQIRIIITGGATKDTINSVGGSTIIILVEPAAVYPREIYEKGVKLMTFPIKRIWAKAKTINYIPAIIIHKKAVHKGFYDGIYLDEKNNILEAANANLFFFIDDKLITPKEEVLFGITRKVLIDLVKKEFPVTERFVNLKELSKISECFLTVSSKEIVPVFQINQTKIGNGQVGKKTKRIIEIFKKYTIDY